jgi:HSP20 family protein
MTLSRHFACNPSHRFQDEIRHVFNHLRGASDDGDASSKVATGQWQPRVDIKEEDKRFVIVADIPGVDPAAIEINMDKGVLSIKGERTVEPTEENGKFTRVERLRGAFYRSFALPDSADAEGISAVGKYGVLEISIPKKPETTPRRISINS